MSKTNFGENLKEWREKQGSTLEELAKKIDSTKSYLWELENKPNARPSADLAYRLAVALETTIGVLMGETPHDELQEGEVFFRKYQKLGDKTKRRLGKLLDALDEDDD